MTGTIIDRFEIKGRTALEYGAEGVVVIFKHEPLTEPPAMGDQVLLVRPDGWLYAGKAEDVRFMPSSSSSVFFLRGLNIGDVPVGAGVRWGQDATIVTSAATPAAGRVAG